MIEKSPDAFRTISEVAEDLDLPQHVLRFWETRFSQIKPLKRGGGRRYYRPDDVDLLRGIKKLLYEEGYTIRGLQRILKEQGLRFVIGVGNGEIQAGPEGSPHGATVNDTLVTADPAEIGFHPDADEADDEPADIRDLSSQPGRNAAMSVSDFTKAQREKGGGFLDRFRGRGPAETEGASSLDSEDRRSLQATLYELLECKRLLDQVRGN